MDISRIIKTWHSLATGSEVQRDDVFFRFVALWVAFNALYSSFSDRDIGDRQQVRGFAKRREVRHHHTTLINTDASYREAVSLLQSRGITDTATGALTELHNIHSAERVLMCTYQVRCNLFHGGKLPDSSRDQQVVSASFTILSKIIDPFLPPKYLTNVE